MQRSIKGLTPQIADSAFISEMAYLIGDVSIEENASVWPFVCVRGDAGPITIGKESNIQEFSMLHGAEIGNQVTIGHNVTIDHGTVEDTSLVGIGSVVLNDAVVESNSIVAAGSVITREQTIPEGHLAYGIPAETRPLTEAQLEEIQQTGAHYVDLSGTYRDTDNLE